LLQQATNNILKYSFDTNLVIKEVLSVTPCCESLSKLITESFEIGLLLTGPWFSTQTRLEDLAISSLRKHSVRAVLPASMNVSLKTLLQSEFHLVTGISDTERETISTLCQRVLILSNGPKKLMENVPINSLSKISSN
jgi:hypothetical protein